MKAMIGIAAVLMLAAAPALALEVREQATIKAPIEQVWTQVGPFCAIANWHPAVEGCTLRKSGGKEERDIALKGGGAIQERLMSVSAAKHRLRYTLLNGPLPVKNYSSTIRLSAVDARTTRITWSSSFQASGAPDAEARKVIAGIYTSGIEGLRKQLESTQ
ncbi:SRPBCC family protein [Azospirillum humicireducens]|uniref:SRPBCC family protein n=1 Tax=Azospirillum humicireducens TaxID=1226968 RepID=A0A160JHI3_9PROT|nr:SRPBCC family protein [Azospirillum humicireducens]ANC92522.1 SRPBCC family protein [Azospirillum humicireducens]